MFLLRVRVVLRASFLFRVRVCLGFVFYARAVCVRGSVVRGF